MDKETIDQAVDKAVDLIKNNDLRNKIFKGCERVYDKKSKPEKFLFLKQDSNKIKNRCLDFFNKYYKQTTHVTHDGHCGVRSAALAMGLCKEDKDLTKQDITNLRKEFCEIAKKAGTARNPGGGSYEEWRAQFQGNNWLKDKDLATVSSIKANKPCFQITSLGNAITVNYSNCDKSKIVCFGGCGPNLTDFMDLCMNKINMQDDFMVILLDRVYFQPLDIKKINKREFITEIVDSLFYFTVLRLLNSFFITNPKTSEEKKYSPLRIRGCFTPILYSLLPMKESVLILKNIDEILKSTPESDKLSVLLAIAEELFQEFNARIEKFKAKANELKLDKNNDDVEPPKTEESENKIDTHEQKNNLDQANNAKIEQLKNKTNELDNDTHEQKDNSVQSNDEKTEQQKNKTELKKELDKDIIKKLDDLVERSQTLETFEKDLDELYKPKDKESKNLIEDNKIQKELDSVFNKNKSSAVFYKIGKDTKSRQNELAKLKKYFIICIVFSNMSQQDKNKMIAEVKNAGEANVFRYMLIVLKNFFTGKIAAAFSPKIMQSLNVLSEIERKLSKSEKPGNEVVK